MKKSPPRLPADQRLWQGAALFLGSLFVFFLATIILYFLYAYWRRDEPQAEIVLPSSLLFSTFSLLGISLLVHLATQWVRRSRRIATAIALAISTVLATAFMVVQGYAMWQIMETPLMRSSLSKGVGGMIVILAILHALHVAGGVIALGIVAVRSGQGSYDHERHGAVDFAAAYWHFLDGVWLLMLLAFWMTTEGFAWI